jgi:hypothetical protein
MRIDRVLLLARTLGAEPAVFLRMLASSTEWGCVGRPRA